MFQSDESGALLRRRYSEATVMPEAETGVLVGNKASKCVVFTVRRARTTDTRGVRTAKLSAHSKFWQARRFVSAGPFAQSQPTYEI